MVSSSFQFFRGRESEVLAMSPYKISLGATKVDDSTTFLVFDVKISESPVLWSVGVNSMSLFNFYLMRLADL